MTNVGKMLFGGGLALLVGIPGAALALQGPDDSGRAPPGPHTRAELVAHLQERFNALDANHDGVITADELQAAHARAEARHEERRRQRFAELDTNHDGQLSYAEFAAGHMHHGPDGGPPQGGPDAGGDGPHGHWRGHHGMGGGMGGGMGERGDLLARDDANHDGRLTFAEFSARPLARFDRLDTDHNGVLSPEEMRAGWHERHGRHGEGDGNAPPPPPAQ